jgi:hypothetical protein
MINCINCGVELEDGFKTCPLCGKDPLTSANEDQTSLNYPSDIIYLQKREGRKYLWELFGIVAFSGIAVCTIVDLLVNKSLSWSLFTDISLLSSWVTLTLFLHAYKRAWIILPGLLLTILCTLFFIDLFDKGHDWFLTLGLPIALTLFIAVSLVIVMYRSARLKGLNIIADALIVVAGFCIATEIVLDLYIKTTIYLTWSLIVAVSTLPVALVLFFYHYRLKKGNRLDSFFHV